MSSISSASLMLADNSLERTTMGSPHGAIKQLRLVTLIYQFRASRWGALPNPLESAINSLTGLGLHEVPLCYPENKARSVAIKSSSK